MAKKKKQIYDPRYALGYRLMANRDAINRASNELGKYEQQSRSKAIDYMMAYRRAQAEEARRRQQLEQQEETDLRNRVEQRKKVETLLVEKQLVKRFNQILEDLQVGLVIISTHISVD